jgi:hypothetical protein
VILQQAIVNLGVNRANLLFQGGMLVALPRSKVLESPGLVFERGLNVFGVGVGIARDPLRFRTHPGRKVEQFTQPTEQPAKSQDHRKTTIILGVWP